jgi:hypothetical protein
MILTRETLSTGREIRPIATLSTTNLTWIGGDRPLKNHLKCCVAWSLKLNQIYYNSVHTRTLQTPNGKCFMDCLTVEDEGTRPLKQWEMLTQRHSGTSEKTLKPWFILFTKIIAVHFQNYTKHTTVRMAECSTDTCSSRSYMIVTAVI